MTLILDEFIEELEKVREKVGGRAFVDFDILCEEPHDGNLLGIVCDMGMPRSIRIEVE